MRFDFSSFDPSVFAVVLLPFFCIVPVFPFSGHIPLANLPKEIALVPVYPAISWCVLCPFSFFVPVFPFSVLSL